MTRYFATTLTLSALITLTILVPTTIEAAHHEKETRTVLITGANRGLGSIEILAHLIHQNRSPQALVKNSSVSRV